ncbi:hypothetical protein SUDANB37_04965 [Streptomyces sp. enrichment culture]
MHPIRPPAHGRFVVGSVTPWTRHDPGRKTHPNAATRNRLPGGNSASPRFRRRARRLESSRVFQPAVVRPRLRAHGSDPSPDAPRRRPAPPPTRHGRPRGTEGGPARRRVRLPDRRCPVASVVPHPGPPCAAHRPVTPAGGPPGTCPASRPLARPRAAERFHERPRAGGRRRCAGGQPGARPPVITALVLGSAFVTRTGREMCRRLDPPCRTGRPVTPGKSPAPTARRFRAARTAQDPPGAPSTRRSARSARRRRRDRLAATARNPARGRLSGPFRTALPTGSRRPPPRS